MFEVVLVACGNQRGLNSLLSNQCKKVGRYRLRQMLHNNRDIIAIFMNHCQINVIIEHKITTQKQMKWKYPGVLRAF